MITVFSRTALLLATSLLLTVARGITVPLQPPISSYVGTFANSVTEVGFPLPDGTSTLLRISPYEGESLEIVLPDNTVLSESAALARGIGVVRSNGMTLDPLIARDNALLITLPNPVAGSYRLRLRKTGTQNQSSTTVEVQAVGTGIESGLQLGLRPEAGLAFAPGEQIPTYLILLQDGYPLNNAKVRLDLFKADLSAKLALQRSFALQDTGAGNDARAGDGVYSASMALSEPGNYLVSVNVEGTNQAGQRFNTRSVQTLSVQPQDFKLVGTFVDQGVDQNGDGLFDQVEITLAGTGLPQVGKSYYVALTLQNPAGELLVLNSSPDAPFKVVVPVLPSDPFSPDTPGYPSSLQGLGTNQPLRVVEVRLYRALPDSTYPEALLDVKRNLGNLNPYAGPSLQRPLSLITGVKSVTPLDTNSNLLFDRLQFKVGVDTRLAGYYSYSAEVQAPSGQILDVLGVTDIALGSGTNELTLNFSGFSIGAGGKDGPYKLTNLLVYPSFAAPRDATVFAAEVGQSGPLKANQFEGYIAPATAPVRPILECVSPNPDGSFTAYFGYKNENAGAVNVELGNTNKFTPNPQDRGQPTVFQPGRTPYYPNAAFAVRFDGNNLVWTLLGRTSTASRNSTRCTP